MLCAPRVSSMHSVPLGSETHFAVVVVSEQFEGVSLLNRHRSVHTVLSDELRSGVHALSVSARTPTQWQQSGGAVSKSRRRVWEEGKRRSQQRGGTVSSSRTTAAASDCSEGESLHGAIDWP